MRDNEEFFNDIRQMHGVEGFEDFLNSDMGLKMKSYADSGMPLDMLQEITSFLKHQSEILKLLPVKDPNNIRALMRGLTFELIVATFNQKLHEDVLAILNVIDDGFIDMVLNDKEEI